MRPPTGESPGLRPAPIPSAHLRQCGVTAEPLESDARILRHVDVGPPRQHRSTSSGRVRLGLGRQEETISPRACSLFVGISLYPADDDERKAVVALAQDRTDLLRFSVFEYEGHEEIDVAV